MFCQALTYILPEGGYPNSITEYLRWDDIRVMQLMQQQADTNEACSNIINRIVYPRVLHTEAHPNAADKREFLLVKRELYRMFGENNFIEDFSADKMPHKIPTKTEVTDENAIVIIDSGTGKCSTISESSHIIRALTDKIDILRLYVKPDIKESVLDAIQAIYRDIQQ